MCKANFCVLQTSKKQQSQILPSNRKKSTDNVCNEKEIQTHYVSDFWIIFASNSCSRSFFV